MTDRDQRYNRSKKGRARDKRREQTEERRRYKREWARAYRKKLNQSNGGAR